MSTSKPRLTKVPAKNSFGRTAMMEVTVHHSFEWNGMTFIVTETLPGSDIVGRENVRYGVTEPTTGMLLKCYSDDPKESERLGIKRLELAGIDKVRDAIARGIETVKTALAANKEAP